MQPRKINVLFLGGGKRVSAANLLIEAGGKLGYEIIIYSYERSNHVPIAEVAQVILGRSFLDPTIFEDVFDVIKRLEIDIVLAFHDLALPLLPRLESKAFAPNSGVFLTNILASKKLSSKYFDSLGIAKPPYGNKAPLIAKPDFGSASKGIVLLKTQAEVNSFFETAPIKDFDIQEFIVGREYSIDGYRLRGNNDAILVPRERIEVLGGEVSVSKTVDHPQLEQFARTVSSRIPLRGPFTIQVIEEELSGRLFCMEINARFGGGMPVSEKAGVPWGEILLSDFLQQPIREISYKKNYLVTRSFREFGFDLESENGK